MKIHDTGRTEHYKYGERPTHPDVSMASGYNEIYQVGGLWFGYHLSDGGSVRSSSESTREAAEHWLRNEIEFSLDFWEKKVRWRENGDRTDKGIRVIRVGRENFTLPPIRNGSSPDFLGYGGRKFVFRLLGTGEVIEHRNVWFGGRTPDDFVDRLPANAEILSQGDF